MKTTNTSTVAPVATSAFSSLFSRENKVLLDTVEYQDLNKLGESRKTFLKVYDIDGVLSIIGELELTKEKYIDGEIFDTVKNRPLFRLAILPSYEGRFSAYRKDFKNSFSNARAGKFALVGGEIPDKQTGELREYAGFHRVDLVADYGNKEE